MVSELQLGLVLTGLAWLGLLVATVHGKYVVDEIGVGAMIGAGIFVLTGPASPAASPALVMAFAFNGVITIFTGMVYVELGSAILSDKSFLYYTIGESKRSF